MKYNDLTKDMRNEVTSAIREKLLKLGINTEVSISAKTIYNGRELVMIESEPFNTTPVAYKSVSVTGEGFIENTEHEGVYELDFGLSYHFDYFTGGTNGVSIGRITFRFFEDSDRVACLGLLI